MKIQLERRRLSGSEHVDQVFENLDLRNALAWGSVWKSCTFKNVKFGLADLRNTTFVECRFEDCDFSHAVLAARLNYCHFTRCAFDQAIFSGANVIDCSFLSSRAEYSNWFGAVVERTRMDLSLRGANLDFGVTKDVDFSGANLWSALIPMNCQGLVGNTFDKRQVHLFLATLCKAVIPEEDRKAVSSIVIPRYARMVDRLVTTNG